MAAAGAMLTAAVSQMRTGRARRNYAKFFEMWWPWTELNRRRQPFQLNRE